MGHETHRAGTTQGCKECTQLAYEPSWYATLLATVMNRHLVVEVDDVEMSESSVLCETGSLSSSVRRAPLS